MPKATIIFDNECSLCRQFTQFLKKWDKKEAFDFRPLQEDQVYVDFPQLKKEECEKAIHLVNEDGSVHSGAGIVEPLLSHFPKVKNITWMLGLPGVKSATEVLY